MASIVCKDQPVKIGHRVELLTVIGPAFRMSNTRDGGFTQRMTYCVCRCDCGNVGVVRISRLSVGDCGCRTASKIALSRLQRSRLQTGDRFRMLTVIGPEFSLRETVCGKFGRRWTACVCQCDCGTILVVSSSNLVHGKQRACGCITADAIRSKNKLSARHGESRTPLHYLWMHMIERCTYDKFIGWDRYGGRNISVHQEWIDSYESFRDYAKTHGWKVGLQIDRIDNDGNYEPGNIRFVTCKVNQNNKSSNRKITAFGETKTMQQWVEDVRCKVKYAALWRRLSTKMSIKWTPELAISTPPIQKKHRRNAQSEICQC